MLAALVWLFPALMAIAFLLSLKASDPWQPARWAAAVGLPLVLVVTIAGSLAHLRGLREAAWRPVTAGRTRRARASSGAVGGRAAG